MAKFEISLSDGTETLDLAAENGLVLQRISIGYPSVRVVSSRRNGISGTTDQTKFFGERTIGAVVALAPELTPTPDDDFALADVIMRWMSPDQRYYLYLRNQTSPPRRFKVRPNSAPTQFNAESPSEFTKPNFQWIAYEGVAEGIDLRSSSISTSSVGEVGRAYDLVFNRTYPASSAIGQKIINNEGTTHAWPVITFYGPLTGPGLRNLTTGQLFKMKDPFALLDGEYLVIDMREGTVLLNGDAANTRYAQIDFTLNDWWQLQEGENILQFVTATASAPSQVKIEWYDTYL